MPIYQYNVVRDGLKTVEIITAEDIKEARSRIRREKLWVTNFKEIEPVQIGKGRHIGNRSNFERSMASLLVGIKPQMRALQQVSSLIESGVPVLAALNTAAEQAPKLLQRSLFAVSERVENGHKLSTSFREEAPFFGTVTHGLLEVGESNGTLGQMSNFAASLFERIVKIRFQIFQASMYPAIVITLAIGVLIYLLNGVLPKVVRFLKSRNASLPPITQSLLDLSAFMEEWGTTALAVAVLSIILFFIGRSHDVIGDIIDRMLLRLPVLGSVFLSASNAVWCRTFGTLLEGGINVVSALKLTQNTVRNAHVRNQFTIIRKVVEAGQPLSTGFGLTTLSSKAKLELAMLATGESSGKMDEGLLNAAKFSEDELSKKLTLLIKLTEPVLFIVIGGTVGYVYIGMFMGITAVSTTL